MGQDHQIRLHVIGSKSLTPEVRQPDGECKISFTCEERNRVLPGLIYSEFQIALKPAR